MSGKKPAKKESVKILKDIYDNPSSDQEFAQKATLKASVKQYFSRPRVVDQWIAGGILFFGLAAIVLGFLQFRYHLTSYFIRDDSPISLDRSTLQNPDDPDLLGLRQKDTDLDGLSDYDELYIYATSPYLKDSDSDGTSDPDEIAAGTDPNCKTGEDCFGAFIGGDFNTTELDNLLLQGQVPGVQIRELLIQAGFSAEELTDFSNAQLQQLYQQILIETDGGVSQGLSTVSVPGRIEDYTPDEIRDLLEAEGIDRSTLDNITDAELIDLVNETLIEL